jgi:hypothetical protein
VSIGGIACVSIGATLREVPIVLIARVAAAAHSATVDFEASRHMGIAGACKYQEASRG